MVDNPSIDTPTKGKVKVDKEFGSAYDLNDMMFAGWDGGAVYEYGWGEARDFDRMREQDGKAVTLLNVLTQPTRSARWKLTPGVGDTGQAAWLEEFLRRPANAGGMKVPFQAVIGQATSARLYRKAYFEKVFDVDPLDGKIIYKKLAWRPPATCGIRRDPQTASFMGFQQRPMRPGLNKNNNLPINFSPMYSWVFINGEHLDPVRGHSDFQIPYWCYVTKMKILYLWHTFLETQSTPRAYVTSADGTSARGNAQKIAKLKNGGVAGLTQGTTVNTIESNGTGARLFADAIQWLDSTAAGSVLAGFTDLPGVASRGVSGSYALSKDQTDFFLMASESFATELASSITNFVLPDLIKYNFGVDAALPTFEFDPLSQTDLETMSSMLNTLAVAPAMNLPFEFLDELAVKVAVELNMDETKISAAMAKAGKQFEDRAKASTESAKNAANMAGQVGAAAGAIKGAAAKDGGTSFTTKQQDNTTAEANTDQ